MAGYFLNICSVYMRTQQVKSLMPASYFNFFIKGERI